MSGSQKARKEAIQQLSCYMAYVFGFSSVFLPCFHTFLIVFSHLFCAETGLGGQYSSLVPISGPPRTRKRAIQQLSCNMASVFGFSNFLGCCFIFWRKLNSEVRIATQLPYGADRDPERSPYSNLAATWHLFLVFCNLVFQFFVCFDNVFTRVFADRVQRPIQQLSCYITLPGSPREGHIATKLLYHNMASVCCFSNFFLCLFVFFGKIDFGGQYYITTQLQNQTPHEPARGNIATMLPNGRCFWFCALFSCFVGTSFRDD